MQTQESKVISADSPASLLALVPSLCGFTPADSLVLVGVAGERCEVAVTLRYDLPVPNVVLVEELVAHAMSVLSGVADTVIAVVYGADEIGYLLAAVLSAQDDVRVQDVLRVEGNRYWSYVCAEESCCPAAGTEFEASAPELDVPVLASRAELAERVAPVTGEQAEVLRKATERQSQLAGDMPRRAVQVALETVRAAIEVYRTGVGTWDDGNAAISLVGLQHLRVRDDAWSRMVPEHLEAHLRLWTDLTRLAPPGFVAAPASLLAFVAWQSGNGALANVALDRALADEPSYSMANLLRQVITSGAPPSLARLPMTPEEVAASYDAQDAEQED